MHHYRAFKTCTLKLRKTDLNSVLQWLDTGDPEFIATFKSSCILVNTRPSLRSFTILCWEMSWDTVPHAELWPGSIYKNSYSYSLTIPDTVEELWNTFHIWDKITWVDSISHIWKKGRRREGGMAVVSRGADDIDRRMNTPNKRWDYKKSWFRQTPSQFKIDVTGD